MCSGHPVPRWHWPPTNDAADADSRLHPRDGRGQQKAKQSDRERMKLMLQSLLADRFQLQVARETQTGTVYTLAAPSARNLNPPAEPNGPQSKSRR